MFVNGASRNKTFSVRGMSFTYNSHLIDWDIDTPGSGIPVLQGYIYLLGSNETDPKTEEYLWPKWTVNNTIRTCLQFHKASLDYKKRE